MISIILADSELEIVPREIQGHPAVVKHARIRGKKPSSIILDSTYHHSAMRERYGSEADRRGRPDIVHFFLMNALESPLSREGKLRVYVHTRNNEVFKFDPKVRLPRAYNRFIGLMESAFQNRYIPDKNNPLITVEKMSLSSLAENLGNKTVILSEKGRKVNLRNYDIPRDVTFIIGGFPRGDFLSNISFGDDVISIFSGTLMAWVASYEVIVEYERRYI